MNKSINIFAIENFPVVHTEQELWQSIDNKLKEANLVNKDIIVIAHTIFSRILGPIYKYSEIKPSKKAIEIGERIDKDPRKVEVVLKESKKIIKVGNNVIICQNHENIVCANAGVDESNAGLGNLIGIPKKTDLLAATIRKRIKKVLKKDVAVIISDTVGRALRLGAVNIAIGVSGLKPIKSEIGKKDLFGYVMKVSTIGIADEIASAAELLQGQAAEGSPIIVVRGYKFDLDLNGSAQELNRLEENRLFK